MNTDGTCFHTCKECHKTESFWNHTAKDHMEGEQLEDRRSVGASSCNSLETERIKGSNPWCLWWWWDLSNVLLSVDFPTEICFRLSFPLFVPFVKGIFSPHYMTVRYILGLVVFCCHRPDWRWDFLKQETCMPKRHQLILPNKYSLDTPDMCA